jgi:hypothetical protein
LSLGENRPAGRHSHALNVDENDAFVAFYTTFRGIIDSSAPLESSGVMADYVSALRREQRLLALPARAPPTPQRATEVWMEPPRRTSSSCSARKTERKVSGEWKLGSASQSKFRR